MIKTPKLLHVKKPSLAQGTISRSTADASMAFFRSAWKGRLSLTGNERLGFGQFFYVFLCSYLESQIFALIDFRLDAMRSYTQTASSDIAFRLALTKPTDTAYFDAGCADSVPAFLSVFKMIKEKDDNLQKAALQELAKTYSSLFSVAINVFLGEELWADLLAVGTMRNLLAHGRMVTVEVEWGTGDDKAGLDSLTIKSVAERLRKKGILPKEATIRCAKYCQWESKIFCDEALLYFYKAVSQIEIKLKGSIASNGESELISRMPCLLPLSGEGSEASSVS